MSAASKPIATRLGKAAGTVSSRAGRLDRRAWRDVAHAQEGRQRRKVVRQARDRRQQLPRLLCVSGARAGRSDGAAPREPGSRGCAGPVRYRRGGRARGDRPANPRTRPRTQSPLGRERDPQLQLEAAVVSPSSVWSACCAHVEACDPEPGEKRDVGEEFLSVPGVA